jgi:hypothetical protein
MIHLLSFPYEKVSDFFSFLDFGLVFYHFKDMNHHEKIIRGFEVGIFIV